MGYQSKTYSLSDEVIEAIEDARARGMTPNRYLLHLLAFEQSMTTDPAEMQIDAPPKNAPTFRVLCTHCGKKFESESAKAVLCDSCANDGHKGDRYGCEQCRLMS